MKITNTFFGFTNSMQSMKKVRTENILNKRYCYNNVVMTCKEHIYKLLKAGAWAEIDPAYSYYSKRLGGKTKPKTDYQIHYKEIFDGKQIEVFSSVTKTEYNYFCYLQDNGFLDDTKAQTYVNHEVAQAAEVKRQEMEQAEKEKAEQERRETEEKTFNSWIEAQIETYPENEKLSIARNIFLSDIGSYSDYNLKKLLILIDNIDNAACKDRLYEWLAHYNKSSKKIFHHITGIKLPQTDKETFALLDRLHKTDYKSVVPFKPIQKSIQAHEKPMETFYIINNSKQFQAVQGEAINKFGIEMFIRKVSNAYLLSESRTGVLLSSGETRTEALDKVKKIIEQQGLSKIQEQLAQYIKIFGMSPKYQEQRTEIQVS